MSYFIFDMDETLAELYSVYYFIATLRLRETCDSEPNLCNKVSDSLFEDLDKGYNVFVNKVLDQEVSNNKLGILRPGILEVMGKLSVLQKKGIIKNVVIYSNNGHLESLEFIRDLIHKYVKNDELIKECIHWNHPMRGEEIMGRPGAANKTWNVLRNILIKGNCKASNTINPSNIYFFDDLAHQDLRRNLEGNYYQVPGYSFKASFERLADIFRGCLSGMKATDMEELKELVVKTFSNKNTDFHNQNDIMDKIIAIFSSKTRNTVGVNVLPPGPDSGIDMMNDAIEKATKQIGGRKRRMRFTIRKSKVKRFRLKSRARKN
jgi:hypothetical protein